MASLPRVLSIIYFLLVSFQLSAQKNEAVKVDTIETYSFKTATIQGEKYIGYLTDKGFHVENSKGVVVLTSPGDYFMWEFKDLNKDGYKDIVLTKPSNISEVFDLILYVPAIKTFKVIENFSSFPAPEKIGGTKYYYSYHKSGCADMNWDSDLFYIQNYKATRLGNISGRQCGDSGIKDGVYINKVHKGQKTLFKTLPIDALKKYDEFKWGFIKDYWTKNYALFL
jgi:hypothetical protein